MSLSAVGSMLGGTPTERASSRDSAADERMTSSFASVLAGAVHAHAAPKPKPDEPKDGTSELDAPDGSLRNEDENTTSSSAADASATPSDASATNTIVRSVAALDPALKVKLARVIARVRDETGHDVTIAETFRSQRRQDKLFAQGRDAAGPVVTWTQHSKHTQGRAVDLLLDGGTAGSEAYTALQRIAGEEGLHTLGAKDPGHVELPGSSATSTMNGMMSKSLSAARNNIARSIATPDSAAPADATGAGADPVARVAPAVPVAGVAQTAPAARVAQVAQVAQQVARVTDASAATPARGASGSSVDVRANVKPTLAAPSVRLSGDAQMNRVAGVSAGDAQSSRRDASDSRGQSGEQRGVYDTLGASGVSLRDLSTATAPVQSSTQTTATSSAERIAKVMAAMDDAPARPLSQITMSVDAGNGVADRVHVSLRGSTLSSTIDTADLRSAQTMSAKSDELVRALNRDGLEVESLRVRAMASGAAPAVAHTSQSSSGSSTGSRFERGNPWDQSDRQQQSHDNRRQQQREQRRGQNS